MEGTDLPLRSCPVPLSLYFHIPFCKSKCDYCDFYSLPGISEPIVTRVLEEELHRLDLYLSILNPPSIETLYIGGGTPSSVPPSLLGKFLDGIFRRLPNVPQESSIEANPESLSEEFIRVIQSFPLNRLSLGIQTFQSSFFQLFHRTSSPHINRRALDLLRNRWNRNFSIDLLYGIPHGTIQEALADLEEVLEYHPPHLSLYQLTSEEGTPYGEQVKKGKLPPLSASREEKIRSAWLRRAREFGLQPYEISNLALPGEECRHNLRYWELRPYLGIGPSAVSTLTGKEGRILRMTETPDVHRYAEYHAIGLEEISPVTFLKEVFLMGLRTVRGIRRNYFRRLFNLAIEEVVPNTVERHGEFLPRDETHFSLTDRGRLWLNRILIDFFDEIDQYPHPITCAWPSD
jgi:oxygen-independent coproporphyrinogen-3 oxidase